MCHVVAEADRYVPGLATAKSRVLKLEELSEIPSVQGCCLMACASSDSLDNTVDTVS